MRQRPFCPSYLFAIAALAIIGTTSKAATLTFDNDSGDNLFLTTTNWDPDTALPDNAALVDDFIVGSAFSISSPSGLTWTTLGTGSLTLAGTQNSQWIGRTSVDLSGTLILRGGNEPLPFGTTVDLTSPGATIHFLAETVTAATNEHVTKITVNGAPAVVGTNIDIVSDGGAGSFVTVIPEPSTGLLLGLVGFTAICRRRR